MAIDSLFCMCNTHQCDGEQVEIPCFCFGKRGRRNGAEPYQKAILTGGGYRGGGITCACIGHIWTDKDTRHEVLYDTDENNNGKADSTDAEEAV